MIKKILIVTATLLVMFSSSVFAVDPPTDPPPDDNTGLIGGLVDGFLNGLKGLFIPDKEFFDDWNKDISSAWDNKVGGLTRSWQVVADQFKSFKACDSGEKHKLNLEFSDNHFFKGFKGIKVDLLGGFSDFSRFIRGLFSALFVVITIWYGYCKISKMFKG